MQTFAAKSTPRDSTLEVRKHMYLIDEIGESV